MFWPLRVRPNARKHLAFGSDDRLLEHVDNDIVGYICPRQTRRVICEPFPQGSG